ncbi:hypothetical protein PCASD_24505 [Puccinia coronata f. sp. avenae]|uniref:Uncharacterized protein n=1 Tax=Puccinia coronata f. sp. avenae TaxID=200324 RepID=A0A2N5RU30_9BASI|nr:hypothetical protein PCASD_24505 [Puccinia coronata f. sp. avenae]
MIIIEPTDDQRNGHVYSPVLVVLFSELDSTNKLRDGVHIQRIRTDAAEQAPLEIPSEGQKPSRFYASEGEEWWKIFPGGACGYVQTSQGLIKKVSCKQEGPSIDFAIENISFRLAEFCPIVQCIHSHSISSDDSRQSRALGLTASGKLFLNQELVANDCSSFTADSDHLLYTTFSHQLKFIELSGLFQSENVSSDLGGSAVEPSQAARFTPSMVRAVERGSMIITSVPSSMKVILQMPRGNLEAIHPRPMFLEEGVAGLVTQVDNNDHFGLFLSSLKPLDVTAELYPIVQNWKSSHVKELPSSMSDDQKINTVCDLMVQQLMQKQVQWGYINSILTAMVCRKPPDYKSALGLLTPLRSEFPDKVEDASSTYLLERCERVV